MLNPSPGPTYIYLNVDINQDLPQHRLLGQDLLQHEHVHQQVFNPSPDPTYIYLNVDLNQDLLQHRLLGQDLLQSETRPLVIIFHKMPYNTVTMWVEVTSRDRMGTK